MCEEYRRRDIRHVWHPYTEITSFEGSDFPVIERAEGVYLYEVNGKPLLDGISSWWCVNLGHSHPRLVEAIAEQSKRLQHVILGGMSHPKAVELSERLAEVTPGNLNHAFFASDGSSAVEAGLKMALQYRANIGEEGRDCFISLQDGYHGDTLGAMGTGYIETFHRDFKNVIRPAFQATSPHCAGCPFGKQPSSCDVECFGAMESLIHEHHEQTTAVIVEPLCQGAAGIRIYPEEYLRRLRNLCDEYDLLLIADEIAVGFGRTGSMFACERAGIAPDILTAGKGLTGGYLPMSVCMVTDRIFDSFRHDGDHARTFYHGHTFCGNPITSALALAALDVYKEEKVIETCKPRIKQLNTGMRKLVDLLPRSTALSLGMIAVIEISESDGGRDRAARIGKTALKNGLFIRPLGSSIYLWPPLTTTEAELGEMLSLLGKAIEQNM